MKATVTLFAALLWGLCLATDGMCEHRWVRVQQVVDGDTVRLENGELVRYLGIDAPEIDHATGRADPFAREALGLNRRLVEGKRIQLLTLERRRDHYGRTLAHPLDRRGQLISQHLVFQGLALCYPDPSGKLTSRDQSLLASQRSAMKSRRGIWSLLNEDRRENIIANTRSKRFHLDTCPYGRRTGRRNRTAFSSRRDAHWNGYAPCRRCLGSPIKKGLKRRR